MTVVALTDSASSHRAQVMREQALAQRRRAEEMRSSAQTRLLRAHVRLLESRVRELSDGAAAFQPPGAVRRNGVSARPTGRLDPLDLVEEFLEALAVRDAEVATRCLSDDVYFVSTGDDGVFPAGDYSGHPGWRRWWKEVGSSVTQMALTVEVLDPKRVFVEVDVRGASGPAAVQRACVYTVDHGRITAIEMFSDAQRAYARARTG